MKVLVADDSAPIRERLVERLSRIPNIQIAEAADTPETIQLADEFEPDIAVLDIRMPGGGGLKALKALRKKRPQTTVLIMTNYPYAQYRRKCLEAGADFFFDKSNEFERIAETVRELTEPGTVSEVARRTATEQLVEAREELEKAAQRTSDLGLLDLLRKATPRSRDQDVAYTLWEKTFDAMTDLVAVFDPDRRIIRVNKAAADRLGVPVAELTGKKCYEYFHGSSRPVENCPHEALINDLHEHAVELYDARMGGWFEVSVSPICENDRLLGVIHVAHDITLRKRAEALAQSTLDALSAHIAILDETGVILGINRPWQQFAEKSGQGVRSSIGSNYLTICENANGPHADEARQFAKGLRAVLCGDIDRFEMEYACETATEILWFCGRVTPLPGAIPRLAAVAHEDITARKRAELERVASETRYRRLFESMQDGFALHEVVCDPHGIPCDALILEANPAFAGFSGLPPSTLIGKSLREALPWLELRWIDLFGRVALTGEPIRVENFPSPAGRHYTVSVHSPHPHQFAAIFTDITELKSAEEITRRACETAEEASRAKTRFLANMSHELRTPLNAIIGFTELLDDSSLSPEQRDYIRTIGVSGESLLALIADLLDFSKIELGKMEIRNETFNLRTVAARALAQVADLAEQKRIALSHTVEASVPDPFEGDPIRVQQVLVNLLNNALKFTDSGYVKLAVRNLITPSDSRFIEFAVQDSGEGIHPEIMRRIFEPFQQGDNSTTRLHGGIGLGLAISRELVQRMGGLIYAESRPGDGSQFSFRLPVRAPTDLPVPTAGELRTLWRGQTVCVWDDNPANLRAIESLLERCGIRPRYAETPEAIATRLAKDPPADAVLCNLDLPGLAQRLPAFRVIHPAVPWIALSNWVALPGEKTLQCFSAFIDLPVRSGQLYSALAQLARGAE
jgi:PAS domain S-box-containing protein